MEVGEFATFMALGLHFVVLQRWVKLTLIVLPFAKPLKFYFQHRKRMVGGEKAIFHAQNRFVIEWSW